MGTYRDKFEHDELEVAKEASPPMPRNGSAPPPLPPDASLGDVIDAVNALRSEIAELTKESKSHNVELGGIRSAFHEQGTRIETFCRRIERAMQVRETVPPPAGDAT